MVRRQVVLPPGAKLIRTGGRPQTLIIVLLALHIGLFLLYAFAGGPAWINQHLALSARQALGKLELWQPLSAFWLHVNAIPLAVNMITLWFFGTSLLRWWGGGRFFAFYVITGVVGLVAAMFAGLAWPLTIVSGSSGAAIAMLVAFAVLFPDHMVFFYGVLPLKAKWLGLLLVIFVLIGTVIRGDFIELALQGGGAVAALLFLYNPRKLIGMWRLSRAKKKLKVIDGGKKRDEPKYLN
ncbi:MAG: rhomboid family intramembrane serine protease [Myxococcales bacterium]|nr:rhomboid family intramembrane serine protease [Myxococcales bacterium]